MRIPRSIVLPVGGPVRRLAWGTLASAVGNGAWFTSWALFFTRSIHLSPGQVGIGMTAAGALGVVATPVFGWLGDRLGARGLFGAQLALEGVAAFAYIPVHGMAAFVVVTCVAQIAGSGTGGPRNALVLGLSGPTDRLEVLGRLRAISHSGWALGAILGGAVITVGTRPAYLALLILNGVSYLVYAALVATVPAVHAPAVGEARRRLRVLADRPYVSLAGLMGVLALCWAMLSSGLPLWVSLHTHAPRAVSAVVVLISCVGIAALQVPVSRVIGTPQTAARAAIASGTLLACACVLLSATAGQGAWPALVLILLAAALHLAGELLFVAASWGLSVPLMPPDAPSEYQGAFATGEALALMVAPLLMTTLVAGWGQPGWIVLGAIFLVPALTASPATRWALRSRRDAPARPAAPAAASSS
jgi:hypothetical protein